MSAAFRGRRAGSALVLGLIVLAACSVTEPDTLGSVFLPAPDDPLVHFRILVKVGSANDPSGKDGLCRMTWDLLANGGTRTSSAAEISARLYPLAAAISVTVDKEAAALSADISRENLEVFYAIFKERLFAPGFAAEDLDLLKADRIRRIENPEDEADLRAFGSAILDRLIFEGHPYGRPSAGSAATVAGLTIADARVFYAQHFVRGNIIIGLAGGYPPEFAERVVADFRLLPAGFTPALRLPAPRRPAGPEVLIAERPDFVEAAVMGVPLDPDMTDEERAALKIAGVHLGQDPKAGLTPDRFLRQRTFAVPIAAGVESGPIAAIPEALDALRSLAREGIPEERFELVRESLLNAARLAAGGMGERLRERVDALPEAGEPGGGEHGRLILAGLKRNEVERAVRKYLDPDRVRIAIVTEDAESVRRAFAAIVPSAGVRVLPPAEIFQPSPEINE